MDNYSILGSNIKAKVVRFAENISKGLKRSEFKFVGQMLYGLLGAQSCHLSEIARKLDEGITLKKVIERLSRNLAEFSSGERLFDNYINKVKGCLNDQTILVVDDGDIIKPCSRKLEGLGVVRDGSTGELGNGYHMLDVIALTPEQKAPIGVYSRIFSAIEKGFVSATAETLNVLKFLRKHFKKSNIRAFDRGFDTNDFYRDLIDNDERFVIRAKKNRNVIYKSQPINIMILAKRFKGKYRLKFRKKNGIQADCKISIVPVKLCCRPNEALNLVICNGFGKEPMLLLTNLKSNDDRLAVTIPKVYLLRWRIEELHGFKKQQFGFEDLRVRSLKSIRNLDMLLTIAIGFIGLLSEKANESRQVLELIHISKRIYNTPKFMFYAIADGIFTSFAKCKQGVKNMLKRKHIHPQLSLFEDFGFACA
jgi:hypothetical protein